MTLVLLLAAACAAAPVKTVTLPEAPAAASGAPAAPVVPAAPSLPGAVTAVTAAAGPAAALPALAAAATPGAAAAAAASPAAAAAPRAAGSLAAMGAGPAPARPAVQAAAFDGQRALRPVDGLFGPGSMVWRVNGHHMGRFGALAALATQASHPLVAESAKVTGQLLRDPHRRLLRTSVLLERVMFSERTEALDAVRLINRNHAQIEGRLEQAVGPYAAGTPFSARDPELLKWVLATVYFYTLGSYERYVERLGPADRDRFYAEFRYLGRLLAIPAKDMPADHAGFRAYYEGMLRSEQLAASPAARDLAANFERLPAVLAPLRALLDWPIAGLKRLVTGTLPPRIRELNGLPWTWKDELAYPVQKRLLRAALRGVPDALLRTRAHARALKRVGS
jgi:uncharacterized protein (DUF2236 family)